MIETIKTARRSSKIVARSNEMTIRPNGVVILSEVKNPRISLLLLLILSLFGAYL